MTANLFMNIWISLTLGIIICNSASMFMDWYERKIDYSGFRAAYEYLDKNSDIINDAKREQMFSDFLASLYKALKEQDIESEHILDLAFEAKARAHKILDVVAERQKKYKDLFPQFCD